MITAKKKAAPIAAGRPDINHLEGIEMHYQLSSDDLEVEIGELIDQYRGDATEPSFGLLSIYRHASMDLTEAIIHVDARFAGEHVHSFTDSAGDTRGTIRATGSDLCEALRNVRNAFVESAPAEKAA